ncbi:MAG: DNA-3-methyladenine glycosylase [Candidatus Hydrogenedentota bacterium]
MLENVPYTKLPREFYNRKTKSVARELLGKWLVHRVNGTDIIGRIVETEAYLGRNDLASHSSKGMTPRTAVMFGPPGHAYVYMIYGMYYCMNVVTEPEGIGAAVLLRALEPVKNLDGKTSGPGLLCRSMGIDRSLNRHDLLRDNFYIVEPEHRERIRIVSRPRIGVGYAGEWARKPLRFYIEGNRFISRK